jgi:hypothetical protein
MASEQGENRGKKNKKQQERKIQNKLSLSGAANAYRC